jgi:hypothetical protein
MKDHAQFLHELPDEYLRDMLPLAKKVAQALGPPEHYNILQNNGRLASKYIYCLRDWDDSGIKHRQTQIKPWIMFTSMSFPNLKKKDSS